VESERELRAARGGVYRRGGPTEIPEIFMNFVGLIDFVSSQTGRWEVSRFSFVELRGWGRGHNWAARCLEQREAGELRNGTEVRKRNRS
jgi:hypothetical protein